MYGLLYHLLPKRGWEQEILPVAAGFVAGYIFQPLALPEIVGIFIFTAPADYSRIRDEPKHVQWQQDLLPLIEVSPQRSDGEFTEFMKELRGL
jgi:hypothetical protein